MKEIERIQRKYQDMKLAIRDQMRQLLKESQPTATL